MHLLLTDRLACPRCGPSFGLILRADRLADRRVHEGVLGCPNCRDGFPISGGFADLRPPPRRDLPTGLAGSPSDETSPPGSADNPSTPAIVAEEALRLLALLGITAGAGAVALVGEPARHAGAIARQLEDIQLVAVDPDLAVWPDEPFVSRVATGDTLPIFSRSLRGVAVDGRLGSTMIGEAARVAAPKARVIVTRATEDVGELLERAGLSVLVAEAETVVAARG